MILFEDRAATVLYKVLSSLKEHRKFLLPLNVCPIVPDTFLKADVKFEFVDINIETLCMDEDIIFQKLQDDEKINGILFVKTFGIELDVQPLYKKIKDLNHDIFIIDDMCPSIQDFEHDIENSYADMALFSSGYSKYVDIGYGGFGFLKNDKFQHIFEDKSNHHEFLKYKDEILKQIPIMTKHKEKLNNIYKNNIPKELHLGDKFNTWRFSILIDNKDAILKEILDTDGIFASSHYPQVDYDYVECPAKNSNTKKIHDKILNLFNDFRFDEEKAYRVIDIINNNLNKD